ncbi:MAG: hypothetical protein IJJ55_07385, partial [Clostridia bacterium]|nr:hypothetical protein [Clostridia bacterium]
YFDNLKEISETRYDEESARYATVTSYYTVLKDVDYAGAWGDKLYDFFRDEAQTGCGAKLNNFLPLAASLSSGQRAAMDFLSLPTLIKLGSKSDDVMKAEFPSISSVFKDSETGKELENISVYSGMNRAIFREGVALTSQALMRKNGGDDPYEELWGEGGTVDIIFYSALAASIVTIAAGLALHIRAVRAIEAYNDAKNAIQLLMAPHETSVVIFERAITESLAELRLSSEIFVKRGPEAAKEYIEHYLANLEYQESALAESQEFVNKFENQINNLNKPTMTTLGRWVMGVGGVLLLASAALKFYQMSQFYNRTFTRIPLYIVHEDDIVKYDVDGEGNVVKTIDIDQYVYYEVVKCNRQAVGINKKAQTGVSDYASWGCGDAADLKCDIGKQWLALYVNKSREKGDPILADSIVVQYETGTMPEDCTGCLHAFTYTNAMDIGSDAYSYRNDKKGIYLFWKSDADAFMQTASTFNKGYLALAAFGGLAVGIVGTTVALYPKRKKNKANATA